MNDDAAILSICSDARLLLGSQKINNAPLLKVVAPPSDGGRLLRGPKREVPKGGERYGDESAGAKLKLAADFEGSVSVAAAAEGVRGRVVPFAASLLSGCRDWCEIWGRDGVAWRAADDDDVVIGAGYRVLPP